MIPKSLHTVSVLVAVAKRETDVARIMAQSIDAAAAVERAAYILGYSTESDVYQLKAAAVRKLEKALQS